MRFDQVLNYMQYSTFCPDGIHPGRWRAMVAQVRRVYGLGE